MARSIASIALNQVDLSDAPAATNFADVDCNVGRRLNPAQYGIAAWAMASLRLGIIVLRSMTPAVRRGHAAPLSARRGRISR